jgi:MazG family protein
LLLSEQGQGNLEQVARNAHEKLVRRHPHVFGEQDLSTAGAVRRQWDQIKREQEGREGVFHDVPDALPALLHARKVQRRAAAVGFEYPDLAGALADLEDELGELKAELDGRSSERRAAELGDLLFACVNVARRIEADPELELRQATRRFVARVGEAERLAATEGRTWTELELADQDRYFDLAKEKEKT